MPGPGRATTPFRSWSAALLAAHGSISTRSKWSASLRRPVWPVRCDEELEPRPSFDGSRLATVAHNPQRAPRARTGRSSTVRSRRRHVVPLAVVLGVIVACTALAAAPASAVTPTPFDKNLLRNRGAEEGAGTNGYSQVDIPRWRSENNTFTVVRYGAPGFPTRAEAQRIHGGRKFFSCG